MGQGQIALLSTSKREEDLFVFSFQRRTPFLLGYWLPAENVFAVGSQTGFVK